MVEVVYSAKDKSTDEPAFALVQMRDRRCYVFDYRNRSFRQYFRFSQGNINGVALAVEKNKLIERIIKDKKEAQLGMLVNRVVEVGESKKGFTSVTLECLDAIIEIGSTQEGKRVVKTITILLPENQRMSQKIIVGLHLLKIRHPEGLAPRNGLTKQVRKPKKIKRRKTSMHRSVKDLVAGIVLILIGFGIVALGVILSLHETRREVAASVDCILLFCAIESFIHGASLIRYSIDGN